MLLIRHGETEWSRSGQHTGRTDLPLTARGERQAAAFAGLFHDRAAPAAVLVSPRLRARRTAQLASLPVDRVDDDLVEWDYGDFEGKTTEQIRVTHPGWTIWQGPVPGGESLEQVAARARRVLDRVATDLARGDVVLVGHGHQLRVLTACWLGLEPAAGALFVLDAGALSALGFEHETRVIRELNRPAD